jgi:hypothetical protein
MKNYILLLFILFGSNVKAQFITDWIHTERDSPIIGYSRLEDLIVDQNKNIYVCGTIDSLGEIVPVTMAYDSLGSLLWKKVVTGLNFNFSWRMFTTPTGNIISAGHYEDNTGTNNMIFVERNNLGDSIAGGILNSPGFTTGDDFYDAVIDASGNIYLAGGIRVNSTFPAGVSRFDAGGTFKWLNSYPLLSGWNSSTFRAIEMCADTGMYLLTFNFTGFGSLVYCDTAGNFLWQKTLPISISDFHTQLTVDRFNNAVVGGHLNQNAGIVKLNSQGDTLWSREISYPGLNGVLSNVVSIKTDSAGNIFALATSTGNPSYSIISKFDSSGVLIWADTSRGFATFYGKNKEIFNLDNGVLTFITTKGTSWIYQYTDNGIQITNQPLILTGLTNPEVNAIAIVDENIILTGNSNKGFNIRQGFTAKIKKVNTALLNIEEKQRINIYPNPAKDFIVIKYNNLESSNKIARIFDSIGKQVNQFVLQRNSSIIDISMLPNGVYSLQYDAENASSTYQFVVQK